MLILNWTRDRDVLIIGSEGPSGRDPWDLANLLFVSLDLPKISKAYIHQPLTISLAGDGDQPAMMSGLGRNDLNDLSKEITEFGNYLQVSSSISLEQSSLQISEDCDGRARFSR